jgi:hypothetical protein
MVSRFRVHSQVDAETPKFHKQLKPYPLRILVQRQPQGRPGFHRQRKVGKRHDFQNYDAPQEVWKWKSHAWLQDGKL